MNKETGGPVHQAFPSTFHNGWGEPEKGMTLRDYFAAKAMSGLLERVRTHTLVIPEKVAQDAYAVADQMLKAREA